MATIQNLVRDEKSPAFTASDFFPQYRDGETYQDRLKRHREKIDESAKIIAEQKRLALERVGKKEV